MYIKIIKCLNHKIEMNKKLSVDSKKMKLHYYILL